MCLKIDSGESSDIIVNIYKLIILGNLLVIFQTKNPSLHSLDFISDIFLHPRPFHSQKKSASFLGGKAEYIFPSSPYNPAKTLRFP